MRKLNSQNKYEAVIGLEIHAELKTNSKMFCGCRNDPFHSQQNENVCPVCLGMPGTLPVMNRQALEWTILTGLALNCKIGHQINPNNLSHKSESEKSVLWTKWDRKNYFYPDLPKGYQISQYDLPIVEKGYLEVTNGYEKLQKGYKRIGITRIHLEEDTGTSKHPEGKTEVDYSLLDFNRAGVPLMELVTDPDIRTAEEAKQFCQQYQQVLRNLEIADADMEKGQMRCEVNISLREKHGHKTDNNADSNGLSKRIKTDKIRLNPCDNPLKSVPLGTKVEIKNLNSFKSVEKAIEYEIKRQTEALDSGEKIVQQTRGWDEKKKKTYVMRTKETSADYRYFPEPDLPPIVIGGNSKHEALNPKQIRNSKSQIQNTINIEDIRKQLPELAEEKVKRYVNLAVSKYNAFAIANDIKRSKYLDNFILIASPELVSEAANWIVNIMRGLSIKEETLLELLIKSEKDKKITRGQAKDILPDLEKGKSVSEVIREKGLEQISDSSELEKIVEEVIKDNPQVIESIKGGKMGAIGFLVGQVIKESKGQANPKMVNEILRKKLL